MLTDSIDQVLTLRRLLHSATTNKRVAHQTHPASTPHGLYFDLLRISWSQIHVKKESPSRPVRPIGRRWSPFH